MDSIVLKNLKEHSFARQESLRALRTNLQFCGDDVKVILVTSSVPDEGKSTVTMDLARSLTEAGKNVLVVDTDMRKSVLAGRLKARTVSKEGLRGLSHYLSGQSRLQNVMYATQNSKLFMIFAGPSVPNPTEILEKEYFRHLVNFAREKFDYVLIDCAPLCAAIDAAVIAKHCDGAILVIAQGVASQRVINGVKKQLEHARVRILGAVLNKVESSGSKYGKYYGGYYGSYYGDYSKKEN